jgi:aspartate aminotransferase
MFEMASKDAIQLGLGEPDFDPPPVAIEALKKALDDGRSKYSSIFGLPELRQAIAEYCQRYDETITSENVVVTLSGSEALMATAFTFYNKGDEILIPDPGFVFYRPHAQIHGAKPVPFPLKQENAFKPTQDDLLERITSRTKAIIVNFPSNPCGSRVSKEEVRMISDIARDKNLVLITDEVYDQIVYEGKHNSFLGQYENVVFINSFSKTYAMPGWRIGYFVAKEEFVEKLAMMHYYMVACPSTPIQLGVLAAIKHGQEFVDNMLKEFRKRREVMVHEANKVPGFNCLKPEGAFYAFPSYEQDIDDKDLARKIVEAGVICSPGSAFGAHGTKHIRFSYANNTENIKKGMAIVRQVVENL